MAIRRNRGDRVLIVDDDASLAEMLEIILQQNGLRTQICTNGSAVIDAIATFKPDVVLLDLMLPGVDGMTLCREIRNLSQVPIIMVTAKAEMNDIVQGLEAGADDYITKPFRSQELVARVRARLRRTSTVTGVVEFGDIVLNSKSHVATRKGQLLELTPLEFDLLACLISTPDQVFTREELLTRVWGYNRPGDTRLVNVHMTRLRSKIEDDAENPSVIRTVRGVGYQAIAPQ